MEYATIAGNYYTITSKSGCTVTDATGTLEETVEAGKQLTVQAPSDKLVYDDEQAIIFKATFNYALAALGLLGGGDKLPAGYTPLEFLHATGTQWIAADGDPLKNPFEMRLVFYGGAVRMANNFCGQTGTSNNPHWFFYSYSGAGHLGFRTVPASTNQFTYTDMTLTGSERKMVASYKNGVYTAPDGSTYEWGDIRESAAAIKLSIFTQWNQSYSNKIGSVYVKNGVNVRHYVAALDSTGTPCMFDLVSRTAFYNAGTGAFIAGFTLAQAAQLGRKLPSEGGELTVSVPEGYDSNEAVVNSLALAADKGWVLTVQTYAAETAAATFALRRVWVRRVEAEHGGYVAADGSRWQVDWCVDVVGADPQELGYERFRSVDAATEYWGLVPYVDPNAEELSTDE